jgi:hypothetical protein
MLDKTLNKQFCYASGETTCNCLFVIGKDKDLMAFEAFA